MTSLILTTILSGRCFYYPRFTDEETAAQRGSVTWPKPHSCVTLSKSHLPESQFFHLEDVHAFNCRMY